MPVLWADAPGSTLSASLMFRVGMADEQLPFHGVSHLVEHLTLFPLKDTHVDFNGSTGQVITSFPASGRPDEVGSHLSAVVESLAALPFDRVPMESRVLRAEAAQRPNSAYSTALSMRYGPSSFGLIGHEEFVLLGVETDFIDRWRTHFFNRANAVLLLTGPPPPTLSLAALPDGHRVDPPASVPLPQVTPARTWVNANANGVAVSFLTERSSTMSAAFNLLAEHLHGRLRDDLAMSYGVGVNMDPFGPNQAHWLLGADCRYEDRSDVAGHLQTELSRLRLYGFDVSTIAKYIEQIRRNREDERIGLSDASSAANALLLGAPERTPDEVMAEIEALTPESVARELERATRSALWVVPAGTAFNDGRLHELAEQGPAFYAGTEFRTVELPASPDEPVRRLHIGTAGITFQVGEQSVGHAWPNVVAAKRWTDGWTLFGRDGFVFTLRLAEWVGGESIDLSVRQFVDPNAIVVTDESLTGPA